MGEIGPIAGYADILDNTPWDRKWGRKKMERKKSSLGSKSWHKNDSYK